MLQIKRKRVRERERKKKYAGLEEGRSLRNWSFGDFCRAFMRPRQIFIGKTLRVRRNWVQRWWVLPLFPSFFFFFIFSFFFSRVFLLSILFSYLSTTSLYPLFFFFFFTSTSSPSRFGRSHWIFFELFTGCRRDLYATSRHPCLVFPLPLCVPLTSPCPSVLYMPCFSSLSFSRMISFFLSLSLFFPHATKLQCLSCLLPSFSRGKIFIPFTCFGIFWIYWFVWFVYIYVNRTLCFFLFENRLMVIICMLRYFTRINIWIWWMNWGHSHYFHFCFRTDWILRFRGHLNNFFYLCCGIFLEETSWKIKQ